LNTLLKNNVIAAGHGEPAIVCSHGCGGDLTVWDDVAPAFETETRVIGFDHVGWGHAILARVFEPFFTSKPIFEGTGRGLSMVYGFVRRSGGQARIDAKVGAGAVVSTDLPCPDGSVSEDQDQAASSALARAEDRKTVLVVDDEPMIRILVADLVADLGCTVIQAGDSTSGLTILQSDVPIDLLITDVCLPGMNGREMADAARVSRPRLKVLFITGDPANAGVDAGDLEQDTAFLTKPFAIETIVSLIRSMIEI
jgi:CheY-like chemotaxis protein